MEKDNEDNIETIRIEDEEIENSDRLLEQMMVIEINFGPGKCDEILIHYGDDITELAESFVVKHGLKKSAVSIIENHIGSTIEEFISKNENEDYQEEDDEEEAGDDEEREQYKEIEKIDQHKDGEIINEEVKEIINEIIPSQIHNEIGEIKFPINLSTSRSTTSIEDLIESTIEKNISQKNIEQGYEIIQGGRDDDFDDDNNSSNNIKGIEKEIQIDFKVEDFQYNSNSIRGEAEEYHYENEINHKKYFDIKSIHNSLSTKSISDDIIDNKSYKENSYNLLKNKMMNTNHDDSINSLNEHLPYDSSHLYDQFLQLHKEQVEIATNERVYMKDCDEYSEYSSSNSEIDSIVTETKEEMYARLRNTKISTKINQFQKTIPSSKFGLNSTSTSNTATAINKLNQSNNMIKNAKNTNDRLYYSSFAIKAKKEMIQTQKTIAINTRTEENKFKLNKKSRELSNNLKYNGQKSNNIGIRLYENGLKSKEEKEKIITEAELKNKLDIREKEWSCTKCATFFQIPFNEISKNKLIVCPNCGWDKNKTIMFQPQNVAIESGWSSSYNDNKLQIVGTDNESTLLIDETDKNDPQFSRKTMNNEYTFHPVLNPTSVQILKSRLEEDKKKNSLIIIDDNENKTNNSTVDYSKYFQISAYERLYKIKPKQVRGMGRAAARAVINLNLDVGKSTELDDVNENGVSKAPIKTSKEFVNRITYEYKEKINRQKLNNEEYYSYDQVTGQPLFKPRLNNQQIYLQEKERSESISSNDISFTSINNENKRNVFDDMRRKDEEKKARLRMLEIEHLKEFTDEMNRNRIQALPQSDLILKIATEKSIEEMYKILIASSRYCDSDDDELSLNNEKQIAESICKLSESIEQWEDQILDLSKVQPDLMIPSIKTLISDIVKEKILQTEKNKGNNQSYEVTYQQFKSLVSKCLKKRDGTGHSYVYAPKKRPEVAIQMISKQLKEETFAPVIDKMSNKLCKNRYKHNDSSKQKGEDYKVSDLLYEENEKMIKRREIARKELLKQENEELTFRPLLVKPPRNIQAKYRGVNESLLNLTNDSINITNLSIPKENKGNQPVFMENILNKSNISIISNIKDNNNNKTESNIKKAIPSKNISYGYSKKINNNSKLIDKNIPPLPFEIRSNYPPPLPFEN